MPNDPYNIQPFTNAKEWTDKELKLLAEKCPNHSADLVMVDFIIMLSEDVYIEEGLLTKSQNEVVLQEMRRRVRLQPIDNQPTSNW